MDTEPEASADLWAVPRIVVTTQLIAGAVFLLMAQSRTRVYRTATEAR